MIDFVGGMYRAGLHEGKDEGRVEGITQGIAQGIKEEASRAAKAFAQGVEMLKNLGISPEDIAKFKALYPTQEQDDNNS